MTNEVRIDEIIKEIGEIEMEQDEAKRLFKNFQEEEEYNYDCLRDRLREINSEFEACQGDRHLKNLVEEKYRILQEMERECEDFLYELEEERKKMNDQCESNIDELRYEIQRLRTEVM